METVKEVVDCGLWYLAEYENGEYVLNYKRKEFSEEKQTLMRAPGAEIINTSRKDGMPGASTKAKELDESISGAVSLKQFENPANPLAHYETTGPEIYSALDGNLDYLVADPVGSTMSGGEHGDYNIEGIGNDFIADTTDMSLVDRVIKITDDDAFSGSRELAKRRVFSPIHHQAERWQRQKNL